MTIVDYLREFVPSSICLVFWGETRVLPFFRKILARSEEASTNTRALCDHFGVKPMTDAEGDALASAELAPSATLKPVLEGGAAIVAAALVPNEKKGT